MPRAEQDHYLYFARNELRVPRDVDSETFLGLLLDNQPIVQAYDTSLLRMLGMTLPVVPVLELDERGSTWKFQPGFVDRTSLDTFTGPMGLEGLPLSTDGIVLRDDRQTIVGIGVEVPASDELAIWSGIATFNPLAGGVDTVAADLSLIYVADDELGWSTHKALYGQ